MEITNQNYLDFRRTADVFMEEKHLQLPFYVPHIDKESSIPLLLDTRLNKEGIGGICLSLPDARAVVGKINTYTESLTRNYGKRFVFFDPCSEVLWYKQPKSRQKLRQLNISPVINNIIDAGTDPKKHDRLWADNISGSGSIAKIAEGNLEVQHRMADVCFPFTPVIESETPRRIIDIAFDINHQSIALSESFDMKVPGAYLNVQANVFDPGSSAFSYLTEKLYAMLKDTDDLMLFLKIQNSEQIARMSDRILTYKELLNNLYRIKNTPGRDGKMKRILINIGGVKSLGLLSIYAGADSFSELINGATSIETLFKNTGYRPKNSQFGGYYHPIEMAYVSYETVRTHVKTHGVLPCTGEICGDVGNQFLSMGRNEYAEFKRKHLMESRSHEILEARNDINNEQLRGIEDRIGRSTNETIKLLRKLV